MFSECRERSEQNNHASMPAAQTFIIVSKKTILQYLLQVLEAAGEESDMSRNKD